MKEEYYFSICCFSSSTINDAHVVINNILSLISSAAGVEPADTTGSIYTIVDRDNRASLKITPHLERQINQRQCVLLKTLTSIPSSEALSTLLGSAVLSSSGARKHRSQQKRVFYDYTAACNVGTAVNDSTLVVSVPTTILNHLDAHTLGQIMSQAVEIIDKLVPDIVSCFVDYGHESKFAKGIGHVTITRRLCDLSFEIDHLRWIRFVGHNPLRLRSVFWITHLTQAHVDTLGGLKIASDRILEEIDPINKRGWDTVLTPMDSGGMCIRLFEMPCHWPDPQPIARDGRIAVTIYNIFRAAGFFAWR